MKNSFFLYLLVLSPLIYSQNSLQPNVEGFQLIELSLNEKNLHKVRHQNRILLNKNTKSKELNFDSLLNMEPMISKNEFSSLQLIKQLKILNNSTPFHVVHNPTLERFIRVYLKNRQEALSNLMGKSQYFFPIFETYLDQYNLPLEFKYLAIVESALIPDAISPSGAKGMWQFMLATGKENGLEINSYVDERFDILKSTEAACKYLSSLYGIFKDWDLVLAAYNSGPGNVRKAITRAGGEKNYWKIRKYLPQETKSYVPAFYASYYIFNYADELQIKANYSHFTYLNIDTIHIGKPLKFESIENGISIRPELLKTLNPQYKKNFIPSSPSKSYTLTLPKDKISEFIENETQIYREELSDAEFNNTLNSIQITPNNSYIVSKEDNLQSIANKHKISLDQLKKWNGLQTNFLIEGQRLVITNNNNISKSKSILSSEPSPSTKINPLSNKEYKTYIVKEGDTLFNISRRYSKVTVEQLRDWNQIYNVKFLKPGTKLKIFKS